MMRTNFVTSAVAASLVILALAVFVGCQPAGSGPTGYVVTGTVTYQGKPVDGAKIVFAPAAEGSGAQSAAGVSDERGVYKLQAMPGEYVVIVTKFTQPQPAAAAGGEYVPPEEGAAAPVPENILPAKYASATTSPLRVRVEPRENQFNIELTD